VSHFDPAIRKLIRRKAHQLTRCSGFTPQECEDVEQDLCLLLLRRLPKATLHGPEHRAMVATVIRNYAANLLRDRRAAKRNPKHVSSLNTTFRGERERSSDDEAHPTPETAGTLTQDLHDSRLGRTTRSAIEQADLAQDVSERIRYLPVGLRSLARRLKKQSIAEIARATGVPRTTLNGAVRRLRVLFEDASLRDYLEIR
jgi:RNA polymerase sigma factor (sigma-70 family)